MSPGILSGRRIGLLTASASRLGGGVAEAVIVQARMIRALGGEAVVLALADRHGDEDRGRYHPSEVRFSAVKGPAQIGFAPGLVTSLLDAELDLLHLHGIWMYPSRAGAEWVRRTGKPYVISPHGMLDPWITGRGRWKKALARWGYERRSWGIATAFHALTEREASDIAAETGRRDSLVIANAGPEAAAELAPVRQPEVVYLGRIHPKKNISALIDAWRALDAANGLPSGARLTIAGWGEDAHISALHGQLDGAPNSIAFVGPVQGPAKLELLRRARFLALPSLSEGLPMVVLEAWAAGTPVLMSRECNLEAGLAAGAAIDSGMSAASVNSALSRCLGLSEAGWRAMGEAALGLAGGPFAPATIASSWGAAYADLMGISL